MSQTVEVTLPSSTLYVSGTVNQKLVTWTNVWGDIWQAEADRSDDNIYMVELSVTSQSGVVTSLSTVLFYNGLHLITDRTAADVARWQELRDKGFAAMTASEGSQWLGHMKGCYSYTDMNRVEGAVAYLAEKLTALGHPFSPTVKLNWSREDVPTKADMQRYFSNIANLRTNLPVPAGVPTPPSVGDRMDYSIANDLEKVLLAIDHVLDMIPDSWHYSGDIFSGEV
jgi:hypothetical protein